MQAQLAAKSCITPPCVVNSAELAGYLSHVTLLNLPLKPVIPSSHSLSHYRLLPKKKTITMSFHESCLDIRIEVRDDYTVLLAGAGVGDDAYEPAELNLDEHIGNSDGKFQ